MRTVLLVPRRLDHGPRDKIWAWCRKRWERLFPDIPIFEGHHDDGLFNRSAAVNRAATLAGEWDLAVVIDSDVFLKRSQVQAAIDRAADTGKVTWAHRRWRGINEDWTRRIVADRQDFGPEIDMVDIDVLVERTNPISWSCCIVIPRSVFDDAGGFDERFRGWGFEDIAFQSLICGLYGHERIEGDVLHLWHPRSEERIVQGEPAYTASPQYLVNGRLGRRYMYALRRDYHLTDRGAAIGPDELARDLRNLQRDDAHFGQMQRLEDRAQWKDWWPTLEELRDGAKAYRAEQAKPKVTVIVHTGGNPEAWADRTEYLRRSLASLTEMVSGPIVQRVVYSDWGLDRLAELEAIVEPFGFYVAGKGHRGYTGSMQAMWRYISARAKGDYVFAAEDDFLYQRPIDLVPMIETLQNDEHLVQIALLRDAFYQDERETGGILGWPEPAFTRVSQNGTSRLEHRLFFTANPSLFRKSLTQTPWPTGKHSETLFGDTLKADPRTRFAFWGNGEEWVKHIGVTRAGVGY